MEIDVDENVFKLEVDDGDVLIVTMPESSLSMSRRTFESFADETKNSFKDLLKDKDVKIVVIPYGMKVEYFKADLFK
jgi:hypothetical protein